IEQDGVIDRAVAEAIEPGLSVGGLVDLIAGRFERQPHHLPDVRFVVDDEKLHDADLSEASGTVNVKVDPRPGSDWTLRRPPCPSTMRREMVRPSPAPPRDASGTCTNGSKIVDRNSRGMPEPVSATEIATSS